MPEQVHQVRIHDLAASQEQNVLMTDNPYCPGAEYDRQEQVLVDPVQKFLINRRLIEEHKEGLTPTEGTGLSIVGNPEKVGVVP